MVHIVYETQDAIFITDVQTCLWLHEGVSLVILLTILLLFNEIKKRKSTAFSLSNTFHSVSQGRRQIQLESAFLQRK